MSSLSAATLFSVDGLVAVLTGGGSGIGLMIAKALEENGAKVYIVGRRMEMLDKAAKQAKYGNIIPLQGDVTSKEDLTRIVSQIERQDGYINVLLANSGVEGPNLNDLGPNPSLSEFRDYLWKQKIEDFTEVLHVNTAAVFMCTVAFLELLDKGNKKGNVSQKSQVIATSSVAGFVRKPFAGFAYSANKAATTHLMKCMGTMLVPYGIRSNVLAPGLYSSGMADPHLERIEAAGGLKKDIVPLQRVGTEEDMAGAVLYLTSRAGGYLNGSVVLTDGGRLCVVPSTY